MKNLTILKYQWKDLLRGKWIVGYSLIYFFVTDAMIRFGSAGPKAMLSISNLMLLLIPLVGLIYGALYLYQSREFVELLLAQPIHRKNLFWGLFGGLVVPLSLAFAMGTAIPLFYHGLFFSEAALSIFLLILLGISLTILFTGLGFWLGLKFFDDRIKGLGFALVLWLFLGVLYDGLVLLVVFLLGDYPLEKPMLAMVLFNPVDLARIMVLLQFEISTLMGYTGAVFNRFFGSIAGIGVAGICLMMWMVLPVLNGLKLFKKQDF